MTVDLKMCRITLKGADAICVKYLDAIENRGIEKGSEKRQLTTVVKTLTRYIRCSLPITSQGLEDIAEDNELTVEKVRSIAKENDISLSC